MYDVAVIGAGINGCSVAYELSKAGKKVALFDTKGVASGGSGAAGAFISPKFSKAGTLKEILHKAFIYSMVFYEKNFPTCLEKAALLHIAKDTQDAETLKVYKKNTPLELLPLHADTQESVSIDAGIVDAQRVCQMMVEDADFIVHKVKRLVYEDGVWSIDGMYKAEKVVLATGAYTPLMPEPYLTLRGIWGHRIDIQTSTQNNHSLHQFVSISPSKDGVVAIGATHNVHYHPEYTQVPYNVDAGREELLSKASQTLKLEDITVIKDYMGLRSGSFDYLPMLGGLVDSLKTSQNKNISHQVKKADYTAYVFHPHLTMINGSGGYGFVLAPYLAKILCDFLVDGKKIDTQLSPARFFARWAKKNL